ncbi:hypothetical protein QBC39DRAFT_369555 [Podospora conica]|nr:hypothetical protein QBC39DRAFT_369555 [Schizothecium conicum]
MAAPTPSPTTDAMPVLRTDAIHTPNSHSSGKFAIPASFESLMRQGLKNASPVSDPASNTGALGQPLNNLYGSTALNSNTSTSPKASSSGSSESNTYKPRGGPILSGNSFKAPTDTFAPGSRLEDLITGAQAENKELKRQNKNLGKSRDYTLALLDILTGYPLTKVTGQLHYLITSHVPVEEIPPPLELWWDITCDIPDTPKRPQSATLESACMALSWACDAEQPTATIIQIINEISRHLAHTRQANVVLVHVVLKQALEKLPNFDKPSNTRDGWDHMLVITLGVALKLATKFGADEDDVQEAIRKQNSYLRPPYVGLALALFGGLQKSALGGDPQELAPGGGPQESAQRVMRCLERDGCVSGPEFGLLACDELVVAVDVKEKRIQIVQRADVNIHRKTPKAMAMIKLKALVDAG